MKWTTKRYRVYETRIISRFLIIPISFINDKGENEWRWLETVKIRQEYLYNYLYAKPRWKDIGVITQ